MLSNSFRVSIPGCPASHRACQQIACCTQLMSRTDIPPEAEAERFATIVTMLSAMAMLAAVALAPVTLVTSVGVTPHETTVTATANSSQVVPDDRQEAPLESGRPGVLLGRLADVQVTGRVHHALGQRRAAQVAQGRARGVRARGLGRVLDGRRHDGHG